MSETQKERWIVHPITSEWPTKVAKFHVGSFLMLTNVCQESDKTISQANGEPVDSFVRRLARLRSVGKFSNPPLFLLTMSRPLSLIQTIHRKIVSPEGVPAWKSAPWLMYVDTEVNEDFRSAVQRAYGVLDRASLDEFPILTFPDMRFLLITRHSEGHLEFAARFETLLSPQPTSRSGSYVVETPTPLVPPAMKDLKK